MVRYNRCYIVTRGDLCIDSLHILYLIKDTFEYLFGACQLFVTSYLSPLSLYPLVLVVVMKTSGGVKYQFERHKSSAYFLDNRLWF